MLHASVLVIPSCSVDDHYLLSITFWKVFKWEGLQSTLIMNTYLALSSPVQESSLSSVTIVKPNNKWQ